MLSYIRRHLVLKLFLSYLVVIMVGGIVLSTTAELVVPTAFQRLRFIETREHLLSIAIEREITRRLLESIIKNPLPDKSV